MRRRLALVVTATSLALGLSLATAESADARRNVGGTVPVGTSCVKPGTVVLPERAEVNAPCVCYVLDGRRFHNVGRGDTCPSGLPEIKINRRNVGG